MRCAARVAVWCLRAGVCACVPAPRALCVCVLRAARPQVAGAAMADFSMESVNNMHQEEDFTSMAPVRSQPHLAARPRAHACRAPCAREHGLTRVPALSCAAGGARAL